MSFSLSLSLLWLRHYPDFSPCSTHPRSATLHSLRQIKAPRIPWPSYVLCLCSASLGSNFPFSSSSLPVYLKFSPPQACPGPLLPLKIPAQKLGSWRPGAVATLFIAPTFQSPSVMDWIFGLLSPLISVSLTAQPF